MILLENSNVAKANFGLDAPGVIRNGAWSIRC